MIISIGGIDFDWWKAMTSPMTSPRPRIFNQKAIRRKKKRRKKIRNNNSVNSIKKERQSAALRLAIGGGLIYDVITGPIHRVKLAGVIDGDVFVCSPFVVGIHSDGRPGD